MFTSKSTGGVDMKIKVKVGGVEKLVEVGSTIKRGNAACTTLFTSDPYDTATGVGLITVGDTRVVFVKDEATGYTFPIVWEKGKDAKMAVDIRVKGSDFFFKTALNQLNKDNVKVSTKVVVKDEAGNDVVTADYKAERTLLTDLKAKFDERYVTGADHEEEAKNLARLYRGNISVKSFGRYPSYIQEFIPVKVGGVDGTIIVAPDTGDSSRSFAYYVPAKLERSSCLIDSENFGTLGAVAIKKITLDATDAKKMDIEFASDAPLAGVEYLGTSASIIEELNAFETGFGTSYANGRDMTPPPVPPAAKMIPGGIDLTYVAKGDKTKTPVPACILVGPEYGHESNKALYTVLGKSFADIEALDLSHDEFMALYTRENFGSATFIADESAGTATVNGKDVSGVSVVGVRDYVAQKNDAGQVIVRVLPHRSLPGKVIKDYWGHHQYTAFTVADSSITSVDELTTKLDDFTAGKGGLGTDRKKSTKWLKVRVAVKHALVTAALITVLVLSIVLPINKNIQANLASKKAQADLDNRVSITAIQLSKSEITARDLALSKLPDESQKAMDAGMQMAKDRAQKLTLIGRQFQDGTWEMDVDQLLRSDFDAYTQQEGLKYWVEVIKEGNTPVTVKGEDGVKYQLNVELDKEGNIQTERVERELTVSEIMAAGKTYRYSIEHTGGLFAEAGRLVANKAIEKNKTVLRANLDGKTSVVITYDNDMTREEMVEKYEEMYKGMCGEGCGEYLVGLYDDAFVTAVKTAQAEGSIGASDIANEKAILESEAVKVAAAAIAGENAVVLTVKDGVAYIRSEDGSVVHCVGVSDDLENLAEDLVFKTEDNVLYRASDSFKNVFPGRDVSKYADTYVGLNKQTKDGKVTCFTDILEVIAGGDVVLYDGYIISANQSVFNNDEATVLGLLGGSASVGNRDNYDVSGAKTEKGTVTAIGDTGYGLHVPTAGHGKE